MDGCLKGGVVIPLYGGVARSDGVVMGGDGCMPPTKTQ